MKLTYPIIVVLATIFVATAAIKACQRMQGYVNSVQNSTQALLDANI